MFFAGLGGSVGYLVCPCALFLVLQNQFPDILAVVQVALEGAISADSAQAALAAGQLPQGDMLPWMVGQQFQDSKFPSLSGARIVRIATHPGICLLYTSPSPRDQRGSRMPSSA